MGNGERMNAETMPTERRQSAEEPPVKCALGRPLGDCSLRSAGCDSLYDVLRTVYPPPALLAELRTRQHLDPEVVAWLDRLEKAKPRPMRGHNLPDKQRIF